MAKNYFDAVWQGVSDVVHKNTINSIGDVVKWGYEHDFDPNWWNNGATGFGAWINRINGTEASNQQAAVEAEKQRTFDAEQADTAYRRSLAADNSKYTRQVADMQRAGINPATLSGLSGATGSSSVSAPAASGVAASTHAPSNWLAAVASVIGAIVLKGKAGTAAKAAAVLTNGGNAVWPNGKSYRNG